MGDIKAATEYVQLTAATAAYLQGDGSFGLSNAGVVSVGGETLIVDTLFDLPHTSRFLDTVAEHTTAAPIRTVVNTHDNGDHCWGNQLVAGPDVEIIGHERCAANMRRAITLPILQAGARGELADMPAGAYLGALLEPFDFTGIEITPPTREIDDDGAVLDVGGTEVHVISVGPAHTAGDVLVHVPSEGVLYAGDIVFRYCHPLGWDGTFANWIAALRLIEDLGVETVVPGHGPVSGVEGATEQREYLEYVIAEAERLHDAGVPFDDAARTIDPGPYARWGEPERIVFNLDRAYRELDGKAWDEPFDVFHLYELMAELAD